MKYTLKVFGLFVIVFTCYFVNRLMFEEGVGNILGTIIGAGTYILSVTKSKGQ